VLLSKEEKVKIVFDYYDADDSGYLEEKEIKAILKDTYGY